MLDLSAFMNTVDCPVAEMLTVVPEQAVTVLPEATFGSIRNFLTGVSCVRMLTDCRTAVTSRKFLE
jgi:hypothetical protein